MKGFIIGFYKREAQKYLGKMNKNVYEEEIALKHQNVNEIKNKQRKLHRNKCKKLSLLLAQYTFLTMFSTFNTLFMIILKIAMSRRLYLVFIGKTFTTDQFF